MRLCNHEKQHFITAVPHLQIRLHRSLYGPNIRQGLLFPPPKTLS